MSEKLYTPELLGLATELADFPFDDGFSFAAEVRSQSCGSSLIAGFDVIDDGIVIRTGMTVTACAMGQAASTIFVRHVKGRDCEGISNALAAISDWLAGTGSEPDWPDIALLQPALDYPARHGAILLPWRAAHEALCKPVAGSVAAV
ncbi:iron-sulfur cluster assembly scaffold protein [Altererythrobacter sp. ZODW24]|uniref:iron-sulfur cluster assembly scaffold protein n=1 Tax=Altererythrobacter sp. ZODW24 TaxID=2185142 RepID=UPI000DF81DF7|nr:iron-sulfur cluster assembly scaffold protein [Altererythrobacter sp. ZODW24]